MADYAGSSQLISFNEKNLIVSIKKNKHIVLTTKPSIHSVIGLILILFAVFLLTFHPYGIYRKMKHRFTENSDGFNMWRKPAVNIYMKIYVFNVTNKEAFLEGREKLRVEEVGPYTYRQHWERLNPIFNHENATITINPSILFEWIPSLSVGREDDMFLLPNVPYLLFANEIEQFPYFMRLAIKAFLGSNISEPIVPMTLKEYLFGYESEVLKIGKKWMPNRITYEKLGLVNQTYDFSGDVAHVHSGERDDNMAGTFAAYNYETVLSHWKAPCNKLDGSSDGVKYPAEIQPNQTVSFYLRSMCRAIPMVQSGEERISYGIRAQRYTFQDDALDNGKRNAENKCFCRDNSCLSDGLIDISYCSKDFAVALSYPHFYNGDPSLVKNVDGLKPTNKHQSFVVINPDTGTAMRTSIKVQTNAVLGDLSGMADCKAFSNTAVPLMWMHVDVNDMRPKVIVIYNLFLRVLPLMDRVGPYVLLFLGIGLIVFGSRCKRNASRERKKSCDLLKSKWQYSRVLVDEEKNLSTDAENGEGNGSSSRLSLVENEK